MASGYAAVFNSWAPIAGLFEERLAKGAFTRTLREDPDVLALWHHNYDQVLGRTTAGTLRLEEDSRGLHFELDLDPRSPAGALALSTLERGEVRGMSFGFGVRAEEWHDSGTGLPRRTITDVSLWEITVTPIPAYEDTSASLRSDNQSAALRRLREKAERAHRLRGIR
ncbi:HK97 family phage prohead protease [Mesorhizobium sp. YM1C-6-2]|nr:HK97 family phage prohead protease [Mesorhizobium sp. YM1C-6-2]